MWLDSTLLFGVNAGVMTLLAGSITAIASIACRLWMRARHDHFCLDVLPSNNNVFVGSCSGINTQHWQQLSSLHNRVLEEKPMAAYLWRLSDLKIYGTFCEYALRLQKQIITSPCSTILQPRLKMKLATYQTCSMTV